MQVGVGKYADMDVRRLVIQRPNYVKQVLDQAQPTGKFAVLSENVRRYIQIFDAKPFIKECRGETAGARCMRPVTRGTAYHSHSGLSVDLVWWCDTCNPYQLGAVATLISVTTYTDALSVVNRYGGARDYADIIKRLSRAKGMPTRVTSAALEAFFGP